MNETSAGEVIASRYRIERQLGRGGMGVVFRALDLETGRPVAVKLVLPDGNDARLVARLMREARLAARLHHRHVVRVLDYGRLLEHTWSDRFYLAMELVEGVSLGELLDAGLATGTVVSLACQVLSALAHVHARGVLHRDIKPDNILVRRVAATGRLEALLTDFGLAAALDDEAGELTRLTRDGGVLGTPAWMAPEQAQAGCALGPPVDLYAVGAVLFRMLGGRLPFEGSLAQVLVARLHTPAPALRPRPGDPELPAALVATVARLLARDPGERFTLAADVLAGLAPLARDEPLDAARWAELTAGRCDDGPRRATLEAGSSADALAPTFDGTRSTSAAHVVPPPPGAMLWGRQAQLDVLEALAERVESGQGQLVLVTGEPGVGKSALAEHVGVALNEVGRFQLWRARTPPGGGALGALRGALEAWLGTLGQAPGMVELAAHRALHRLGVDDETELAEVVALLRPETAVPGAAPDLPRGAATWVRLLRRVARERPVLVVLDDLATEAATARLIELLLFELSLEPLAAMVVLPLRPGSSDDAVQAVLRRTATAEGQVRAVLELGPVDLEAMARGLEREHGLAPRAAERVARRAGGNPLFALHLVRAEIDGATLDATARSASPLPGSGSLPEAVRGLLEASLRERLSRTPQPSRAEVLLRDVAVLGEQVEVSLLEAFVDESAGEALDDDLDALIEADVLRDVGLDEVAFASRLLREVVLSGVSPRRARRLHKRAADVRSARGRADEAGLVGEHLVAAGELAAAADAWLSAHEHAAQLGQTQQAAHWGRKALESLSGDDPRRGELAVRVGRALRADAELDAAYAVLEPLLDGPDADLALRAAEILAEIHQERAERDAWTALVERMDTWAPSAGARGRAAWLRARAFHINLRLDFTASRAVAEEALALSVAVDERLIAATRIVHSCVGLGASDRATAIAEEMLAEVGTRPDLRGEALRLTMLAHSAAGRTDEMLEAGARMIDAQRRAGQLARLISATVDLAGMKWGVGRYDEAWCNAVDASELAVRFGMTVETMRAMSIGIIELTRRGRVRDLEQGRGDATEMEFWHRFWATHANSHMWNPVSRMLSGLVLLELGRDDPVEILHGCDPHRLPGAALFTGVLDMIADRLRARGATDLAGSYAQAALARRRRAEAVGDRL